MLAHEDEYTQEQFDAVCRLAVLKAGERDLAEHLETVPDMKWLVAMNYGLFDHMLAVMVEDFGFRNLEAESRAQWYIFGDQNLIEDREDCGAETTIVSEMFRAKWPEQVARNAEIWAAKEAKYAEKREPTAVDDAVAMEIDEELLRVFGEETNPR